MSDLVFSSFSFLFSTVCIFMCVSLMYYVVCVCVCLSCTVWCVSVAFIKGTGWIASKLKLFTWPPHSMGSLSASFPTLLWRYPHLGGKNSILLPVFCPRRVRTCYMSFLHDKLGKGSHSHPPSNIKGDLKSWSTRFCCCRGDCLMLASSVCGDQGCCSKRVNV